MEWLLPMFLIATAPKPRRAALAEQILLAGIPGPPAQRLAIAAIGADQQIKRQALAEEQLLAEAVKALKLKSPDDLVAEKYPTLRAAFNRLPVARQKLVFPMATTTP